MHPAESSPAGRGSPAPRVVGTALVLVSIAAGALAAASIADPVRSLGAAVLLALASVGVAAGLLVLRRASWADDAWPAAGGQPSARQQRRGLLIVGAFLLVAAVAGLVGLLLLPGSGESALATRTWWLVGGCGALGAALVALGLVPTPAPVSSTERPLEDPAAVAGAWLRLGPADRAVLGSDLLDSLRSLHQGSVPLLAVSFLPQLVHLGPWAAAALVALVLTAATVTAAVAWRRGRPPWIARDGTALRHGSGDVAAAEIDAASLEVVPWAADATERSLWIVLTSRGKRRASVALRRRGRLVLTEGQTEALAALIERSSIALPRDRSDPEGRFSRSSYPRHLTKQDALAVVREPPGDGEALPIAAQPGRP